MDVWGTGRGSSRGRAAGAAPGRGAGLSASSATNAPTAVTAKVPAANNQSGPGRCDGGKTQQRPAEHVFDMARAEQQDAIKRHINNENEDDDSNDEEAYVNDAASRKVLMESLVKDFFGSTNGGGNHNAVGAVPAGDSREPQADASLGQPCLGRTNDYLTAALSAEGNVCIVCLETIKRTSPMWDCSVCYGMFHMQCIQRWIKEGSYQKTSPLSSDLFPNRRSPWFCPKCRHEYSADSTPSLYYCYCRKVADPPPDQWLMPHSCGQPCGRPIGVTCSHKCLLLCHPGPCPPCPKTVEVTCHCGKEKPQRRRCGTKEWSCGSLCARDHDCGLHSCQQVCHAGACPPCTLTTLRKCTCGKEVALKTCAEKTWHCNQPCGRQLVCGQHICERVCHSPSGCGSCPRSGQRSCPCGKETSAVGVPCTEDVPTCGDTCGRLLECGKHRCILKCHYGPCGQCLQMVLKRCSCNAARERELPCFKPWTCDAKCVRMRACGRHACKRRCCDGTSCPPCEQMCGRALACRNHRCNANCHSGPCYPCPLTVDVKCFCGFTKLTVPCGGERVTKPPKCDQPCRIQPECHHVIPSVQTMARAGTLPPVWHRCHHGPCPPCKQTCGKLLTGCQHSCPQVCHSAVRVRVVDTQTDRIGPWQPLPEATLKVVANPCPPCLVLTTVTCLGGHEKCEVPCYKATPSSCLRKCGRLLRCGNHTCAMDCHAVILPDTETCSNAYSEAGNTCQKCEEPCSQPRPLGCCHICVLPCHQGDCPPCKQMIRMRCHCSAFVKHIECSQWTAAKDDESRHLLQACSGLCIKEMSCGHQCGMTCHAGPCNTSCNKKTNVRCPCKRRKESHPCAAVHAGHVKVVCDAVCLEQQQKQTEADKEVERARLEEQRKREQADLNHYERKMAGGRGRGGRRRRLESNDDELSTWQRWHLWVLAIAVSLSAIVAAMLLTY